MVSAAPSGKRDTVVAFLIHFLGNPRGSFMRLPDRVTGLFLVGLGAAAAYGGWLLPPVPGQPVGPNVFPLVIGSGLALCGLAIAFGIGHTFEEEEEIIPIEGGQAQAPRGKLYGLRALLPPALLLFYVAAADRLGFIITAGLIVYATATALGAKWKLTLPLAVLAPIGIHLIFSKLLRVPLPAGLLPMPW
jgi:putative tricarboxylic transport membrane protein